MSEEEFEGSLVLERLAEINKLDEFWEAIDSDDFGEVKRLMMTADLDTETIAMVIKKMRG